MKGLIFAILILYQCKRSAGNPASSNNGFDYNLPAERSSAHSPHHNTLHHGSSQQQTCETYIDVDSTSQAQEAWSNALPSSSNAQNSDAQFLIPEFLNDFNPFTSDKTVDQRLFELPHQDEDPSYWNIDQIFSELDKSASMKSTKSKASSSQKNNRTRLKRAEQAFGSLENRRIIYNFWTSLPDEIQNDAISLAEAAESPLLAKVQPITVTIVMQQQLLEKGFDKEFTETFRDRRQYISKSKSDLTNLAEKQRKMKDNLVHKKLKMIKMMKEWNIDLDGPIIDLEKTTRNLYEKNKLHAAREWHDAIMYYLGQNRHSDDAACFRRLRSDYNKKMRLKELSDN